MRLNDVGLATAQVLQLRRSQVAILMDLRGTRPRPAYCSGRGRNHFMGVADGTKIWKIEDRAHTSGCSVEGCDAKMNISPSPNVVRAAIVRLLDSLTVEAPRCKGDCSRVGEKAIGARVACESSLREGHMSRKAGFSRSGTLEDANSLWGTFATLYFASCAEKCSVPGEWTGVE